MSKDVGIVVGVEVIGIPSEQRYRQLAGPSGISVCSPFLELQANLDNTTRFPLLLEDGSNVGFSVAIVGRGCTKGPGPTGCSRRNPLQLRAPLLPQRLPFLHR